MIEGKSFLSEYLSIFYYLKNVVLLDFISQEQYVPLSYDALSGMYLSQSVLDISPTGEGRGWVYFDESSGNTVTSIEQTSRVSVYKQGGATVDPLDYDINYLVGGITYSGSSDPAQIPREITYFYNYVSLLDKWPSLDMPQLPVVSFDALDTQKVGYQLGKGKKNIRPSTIDVFASSASELRELTDCIYNGFYNRSVLCLDYNNKLYGHPLDYDGNFNPKYLSITTVSGYSYIWFEDVRATRVGIPVSFSDSNRYRSRITFSMISLIE